MFQGVNLQDTSFLVTSLVAHFLLAFPLWKMATKMKEEPSWFAWVPVLNGIMALKLAKKPIWWIALFFIPVVNFIMSIIVMMSLSERFGINKWWGLLALFSPVNIILMYVLAFMEHGAHVEAPSGSVIPDAAPATAPVEAIAPVGEPTVVQEVEESATADPDLSTPEAPKSE